VGHGSNLSLSAAPASVSAPGIVALAPQQATSGGSNLSLHPTIIPNIRPPEPAQATLPKVHKAQACRR
jgi:hypothetical protein